MSALCLSFGLLTTSLHAAQPVPPNLGYGLDKLLESHLELKARNAGRTGADRVVGTYNGWTTEVAASYAAQAITDPNSDRYLVDITLRGDVPVERVQKVLERSFPGFTLRAVDPKYRGVGIIEGFIALDDVAALSQLKGVRAVILGLRPEVDRVVVPAGATSAAKAVSTDAVPGDTFNKLGISFDQGVIMHRIDRINQFYNPSATSNWTGNGISVGAISDSFDTRSTGKNASDFVATFDLPGASTNPVNTKPVVVLVDDASAGTDEGRGMVENIYKMAPKARVAFATGAVGEVTFGNYIRAMAGIAVNPAPFQNPPAGDPNGVFKADIICDDLSITGEPFYGESIIGNAIDDATAAGVSYFSSAGNNIGINGFEQPLRIVANGTGTTAATNAALVGTNIDLTGVPTNLYAGGFHNFNPNPGQQDVACTWNMPTGSPGFTEMQWDDPYDPKDPPLVQPPFYTKGGVGTGTGSTTTFTDIPAFTAGVGYRIAVTADTGSGFDAIVTLIDPNGNIVFGPQDTGTDEVFTYFAQVTGVHQLKVETFGSTSGAYTVTINQVIGGITMTTDLNLLVFSAAGVYQSAKSLTVNNFATNRPVELLNFGGISGQQLQFVVSRANIPTAPRLPTRFRIQTRGNGLAGIGPAEYFTYNAATSKGHAAARGTNSTAAYSVFRPNLPETFTSPGPAVILFDKDGNLLATPEIRLIPRVAAIDNANTSDFPTADSTSDLDANPNFSGTSSAAPHASGVAALVLEAHGGSGSVTPAQMRTILQTNVYPHDLDPSFASSVARTTGLTTNGKVTITISSDADSNTGTGQNDPNSIVVSYVGPGSLASLTFNPAGTAATGGNVTGGNSGVAYSNTSTTVPGGTVTYFEGDFPGIVFETPTKAFTLGNSTGLTATDVVATTANPAGSPTPANAGFWTLNLSFPTGNFTGGKALRFTVGRGNQHGPNVATGASGNTPGPGTTLVNPLADLFGGGVFIPRNQTVTDGMAYSGTLTDGSTFSGTIKNRIGFGYSNVDGYGLINAEAAVAAPLP